MFVRYLYPSGALQWILVALLCTVYDGQRVKGLRGGGCVVAAWR